MSMDGFHGAKLAILRGGKVLSLQRDDFPGLPWRGLWDLPGGGREGQETPVDCVLRELREELSLVLPATRIGWQRQYPDSTRPGRFMWFLVARADDLALGGIVLGDEGQGWCWMRVGDYLARDDVVPHHQVRLRDYLREAGDG